MRLKIDDPRVVVIPHQIQVATSRVATTVIVSGYRQCKRALLSLPKMLSPMPPWSSRQCGCRLAAELEVNTAATRATNHEQICRNAIRIRDSVYNGECKRRRNPCVDIRALTLRARILKNGFIFACIDPNTVGASATEYIPVQDGNVSFAYST